MEHDIPEFDYKFAKQRALPFVRQIFKDAFDSLQIEDDGRCRVTFYKRYFTLQGDNTEPTKSQWSTLKKKLKRHNPNVFIFKETGDATCKQKSEDPCYFVDFGFFKY